jgi:predicted nucleotide-binding protein
MGQTEPIPTEGNGKRKRRPSTDIPLHRLADTIKVPQAIENANAGQPYPPAETALYMGMSPGSSSYWQLLSSSLRYGLTVGSYKSEKLELTDLGREVAAPTSEEEFAAALVNAALHSPTFRAIYNHFRGKKLPEDKFFANTVIREFNVPTEIAGDCVATFRSNMEFVGLLRDGPTGRWLSSDPVPATASPNGAASVAPADDDAPEDKNARALRVASDADAGPTGPPAELVATTRATPRVFVTHGKKGTTIVEQLKDLLRFGKFDPVIATEHETASKPVPDKVMDDMRSCSAGIIHVAEEERLLDESGNEHVRINENVLIEIGAAMALYGRNFILLVQRGIRLPSNLQGLYVCEYEGNSLDYEATMKLLKAFNDFR